jgi:tol-pal system protein YbgF
MDNAATFWSYSKGYATNRLQSPIFQDRLPPNSPMTRTRLCAHLTCTLPVAVLAAALLYPAGAALAQHSGSFLDNLFNPNAQQRAQRPEPEQPTPQVAQADGSDLSGRVSRIENALRELTGAVEQLQHQNQMLQMQLKRMQDDTEYRFQQMGARGAAPPAPAALPPRNGGPAAAPEQRSDVFDPTQHPNAPGAPRTLGSSTAAISSQPATNEQPIGAPGGRAAGAPLDLSTLAGNAAAAPLQPSGAQMEPLQGAPMTTPQAGQLPPPPPRNTSATGVQLATLPPSASPKDEYQLAYGYVLHKDYALAEQAFRDFVRKYPKEKLLPDAQYWLGESQFQQQRYRDAAESFLAVSTKYEHSSKAPESLLRLGQSLAALHQKEAACATFAEVGRKFPRASAAVKRGVAREQKRAHC